jgi:hypothetical protein
MGLPTPEGKVSIQLCRGKHLRGLPPSGFLWYRQFQPDGEHLMVLHRRALRLILIGTGLILLLGIWSDLLFAAEAITISHSADYFPDAVGNRWSYHGQITEGPLQTIDNKLFTNVSTVTGTKTIKGVTVTAFHDTNPGNHGPSDSYYRRDVVGIVYYGSDPGTPLEKQIIPYQIVRFPMTVPSSFQQFDRTGLDFGVDMDRDGANEKVDVRGWTTLVGRETIAVPAGTFQDAVKVEARMTMRIHLSSGNRTATGTDVMTAWFAKGVGLIRYSERQELSTPTEDRGVVTEVMEELHEYEIKPSKESLSRLESAPEGVFADNSRDHELGQIVFAAGFRAHP